MPPVIGALAGLASLIPIGGVIGFVVKLGVVIGLGAVSSALAKAAQGKSQGQLLTGGINITFTDPIAAHQIIYGERRCRGVISFRHVSTNNEFLYLVITFSGHPVNSIGDIYFDDEHIPLDGSGNATGRLAGFVKIKKGLGTTSGDADWLSTMAADLPGFWTTNHKQENRAKIYVRLKYDRNKFKNGVPNITAMIKGKEVFDPRDSQTKYTSNAVLCFRDFLLDQSYGLGETTSQIDDTQIITEANICEEQEVTFLAANQVVADLTLGNLEFIVSNPSVNELRRFQTGDVVQFTTTGTLPAPLATLTDYYLIWDYTNWTDNRLSLATTFANAMAGTAVTITDAGTGNHTMHRNSEARYLLNGIFEADSEPQSIMENMLLSMAGSAIFFGGKWKILTGAYRTPVYTITASDIVSPMKLVTMASRADLFNKVKGNFQSPQEFYETKGYPAADNATYLAQDGEPLVLEMNFPFTTSATTCTRIGKIFLERVRQQQIISCTLHLEWLKVAVGDTVRVTYDRFGFSAKEFEVINFKFTRLGSEKEPVLGIELVMKEIVSAVFDWNSGEDTQFDLAPNTNLGDPFNLAPPGNLNLFSGDGTLFIANDGTVISRILATWDPPDDFYIDKYDIQFKLSSESEWDESNIQQSTTTRAFVGPVKDGVNYDVRVRATNVLGSQSAWVPELSHTVVGKQAAPSAPATFNITEEPDGTRLYEWTHPAADPDIAGYEIRWFLGSTSDWGAMTRLHNQGFLTESPYESSQLAAGTYTFAIKSIDSSGNESSTAVFVSNVVLGDPRLSNALLQRNERSLNWPGTLVDCFITYNNIVDGESLQVINDLPDTIDELESIIDNILVNKSPVTYTTPTIDLGLDVKFRPLIATLGSGQFSFKMQVGTEAQGAPTGSFVDLATVEARYVKIEVTIAKYLGSDLVLTGDMSSDTNWTDADTGTGVSTISGGTMTLNGGASGNAIRHQTISGLTIGNRYEVQFDIIGNTVQLTVDGDTFGDGAHLPGTNYSVGTNHRVNFVAVETSATISFLNGQNNNADVDNVTFFNVVPVNMTEMSTIIDSPGKVETFDDVNTASSTAPWFESIAIGHFKIETRGGISTITQAQVTALQNVGSGFSVEVISKSTTITGSSLPAAEFKIYNSLGTLTDATVDVLLRGARA